MKNKEKYKQAFSAIHPLNDFSLEVKQMETMSKRAKFKRVTVAVAACIMLLGSVAAAYAADVGGIQRTIQLWMYGDQTEATIQFDGTGNYSMDYIDGEGNVKHQSGGGVSIGLDGTEIPLSEEDLLEQLTAPDVEYADDGTVWVYWFDQKIDITDKFENDICYVKLVNDEQTLYMTVRYKNGYSTSPRKYVDV